MKTRNSSLKNLKNFAIRAKDLQGKIKAEIQDAKDLGATDMEIARALQGRTVAPRSDR